MDPSSWYASLLKPSWAPPAWLFAPAWTVLYVLIAISFGAVVRMSLMGTIPFVVLLPFLLNLVFNFAFTPIQFGLRNNMLAAFDCTLILVTLVFALIAILPYGKWIALVNIPYLLWVMFATTLQFSITSLNRKRG